MKCWDCEENFEPNKVCKICNGEICPECKACNHPDKWFQKHDHETKVAFHTRALARLSV